LRTRDIAKKSGKTQVFVLLENVPSPFPKERKIVPTLLALGACNMLRRVGRWLTTAKSAFPSLFEVRDDNITRF